MTLLDMAGIVKRFPGVLALDHAHLSVAAGEVHALLGENGAGKSTLLKVLAGAQPCDEGRLSLDGVALAPGDTPRLRQEAGIVTIYQEFNLLPHLTVADNMYLGREPVRGGLIDRRRMMNEARAILDELELDLEPDIEVRHLSIASQQMVEIARALTLSARIIVMDEPTATLSAREVAILHRVVRQLKAKGIAVIYVTHRLAEVLEVCDSYTVLRDGSFVARGEVAGTSIGDLVRLMVGRDVEFVRRQNADQNAAHAGQAVLRVEGLIRRRGSRELRGTPVHDVSFDLRAGEILGFAGLVGSGRTELVRLIFGADTLDGGRLYIDGKEARFASPADALAAGIALVPEDRKQQGCFLSHSIRHNLSLPSLKRLLRLGVFVDESAEAALVDDYRQRLRIRMANPDVAIGTLSGGNQQKVLLARCMALSPRVLIVDEPTRGIDIGAKSDVHNALFDIAASGVAVIVVSSELPEVMAVSDRIAVFREGRIQSIVDAAGATEEALMALMVPAGVAHTEQEMS